MSPLRVTSPPAIVFSDEVILVLVPHPVDGGEKEIGLVFVEGCFRDSSDLEHFQELSGKHQCEGNHPEDNEQSSDETKRRMVHQQVFVQDFTPRLNVNVVLQDLMRQEFRRMAASMGIKYFPLDRLDLWSRDGECFIPLNPVRFSTAILDAMDRAVPSHLPTPVCDVSTPVPHGKQVPDVERRQTAVASKRRPARQQVATSPTRGAVVEEVEASLSVVEVSSQATPTSSVPPAGPACPIPCARAAPPARAAREEAEATLTLGAVEVTSEPSPTSPVPVAVREEKSLQMQRTPLSTVAPLSDHC
ncbi:hypothetical protein ABVT39_010390 [Epinephelus coioides]